MHYQTLIIYIVHYNKDSCNFIPIKIYVVNHRNVVHILRESAKKDTSKYLNPIEIIRTSKWNTSMYLLFCIGGLHILRGWPFNLSKQEMEYV